MKNIIKYKVLMLLISVFWSYTIYAQHKIPSHYCLSEQEKWVASAINKIREANNKKPLQLSVSLSFVARTHVVDLQVNHPDTSICNLSSWSNKGNWTPCCYNPYVVKNDGMWDKPKELTNYRYRGYELASYFQDGINVDTLLHFLQNSDEALNMILTQDLWSKKSWVCMGVGLSENYASLWFGQREDKDGTPEMCHKQKVKKPHKDLKVEKMVYYLIVGSFPNLNDAKEALRRMKKNGYHHAGILQSKGRIRIYINQYSGFKAAMKAKSKLPYSYRKSWVLEGD